jgi:hypothetical protein
VGAFPLARQDATAGAVIACGVIACGVLAAAATAPTFDKSDIEAYTESILSWWRMNDGSFPTWSLAARMVFALSPNSASCERVFSLLKSMFSEQQLSVLGDYIRAAIMLKYNKRVVG